MLLIDSHVHLSRDDFATDREAVLARAGDAGVRAFLEVGYDLDSSARAVALAAADERVYATVGVHPHDASALADPRGCITAEGEAVLERLAELARQPRVVAVGEIGLDFFRDLSPRPAQLMALRAQLALAKRLALPVVLHVRDAYEETIALLDAEGPPARRGVLHAFGGDAATAAWARERGFLLGIGGPVTYRGSRLPEIVRGRDPAELLLETDAPWLPPHPHRGRRNEPAWLRLTAETVADLCETTVDEVARLTAVAFHALFATAPAGPRA